MHTLWEKCSKYCQEEDEVENIENPENDLNEHLINPHYFFVAISLAIILFITLTAPIQLGYQILPSRYQLVFRDYMPLLANPLIMFLFYLRNPHLRNYMWRNILHLSSVQPIENNVELELGPI